VAIVVIDTNVLLSQPGVIDRFGDAEVVIPDTVLGEVDKLKTARVDPELRYRGRALSRRLFDLAESGDLAKGVDLPTGGIIRVASVRDDRPLPDGLSMKNADDRILAVVVQERLDDEDVTLVTNDLNMLLRAQSHGVTVERAALEDENFSKRWIVRPFQRYKAPLGILAVAIAVFAAIVYLVAFSPLTQARPAGGLAALPEEYVEQLSPDQQQIVNYLYRLESDPKDVETRRKLAVLYDQLSASNPNYLPYTIKQFEALLLQLPSDTNSRTDLASAYYRAGRLDKAVQEVGRVLRVDPENVNANFNLGVFYMEMQPKEYQKAATQFARAIELAKATNNAEALRRAQTMLESVKKAAAEAGTPVKLDRGTL
jgi:tetratricopeptide (TPR) repeat protein